MMTSMIMMIMMMMMILKFYGTSTPKGSYSAKAGVNCPMNLRRVHWKRMLGLHMGKKQSAT